MRFRKRHAPASRSAATLATAAVKRPGRKCQITNRYRFDYNPNLFICQRLSLPADASSTANWTIEVDLTAKQPDQGAAWICITHRRGFGAGRCAGLVQVPTDRGRQPTRPAPGNARNRHHRSGGIRLLSRHRNGDWNRSGAAFDYVAQRNRRPSGQCSAAGRTHR